MLWKFILINSKDMTHIGELSQARGKKLDIVLSKPGSATFSYPMNARYAELIKPYQTGIKAMRWDRDASKAAGHAVWDCFWSGYVLPIDESATNNSMNISCIGWMGRLGKRMLRRQKIYLDQDDGAIVADLVAEVNLLSSPETVPYTIPVVPGSNPNTPTWLTWGGTQPDQGAGGATAYVPANRNKTMPIYANVLTQIDELVNIENGGDIVCDPLTRAITWHRRYRRVRDDVVFGFQWGPHNVADFGRNIEADAQVNYLVCTGAPGVIPQYAHNVVQQADIGLIEESMAVSDMRDVGMLLAYAGSEIIVRAGGHITYSITPFPVKPDRQGNVPEPFVDYRPGDQVRFTAEHPPRIDIRGQAIRIFGISINIDDQGLARLGALQVAP